MTDTLILFESALELIPKSLRKHPLIRKEWQKNIKNKNRGILLDGAIHRPLLESLETSEKRGRPDIIHHSLLSLLYSPIFLANKLKLYIHTRNNICIKIPVNWRVPVNYNRFVGLFSQLLLKKHVPLIGKPILTAESSSLSKLIQEFSDSEIYLCEQSARIKYKGIKEKKLSEITKNSSKVFLVGGFQHGDADFSFLETNASIQNWTLLSLYKEIKPAWVITAKIINWLENNNS